MLQAAKTGDLNTVKRLAESGENDITLAFSEAAKHGHLNVVEYLVEHRLIDRCVLDSALEVSVDKGHFDIVQYLLEGDLATIRDYTLMNAARKGRLNVMQCLVKYHAARYDSSDGDAHEVALDVAIQYGYLGVVKCLTKNYSHTWASISSAILTAATKGYIDIVQYLANEHDGVDKLRQHIEDACLLLKPYFDKHNIDISKSDVTSYLMKMFLKQE